MADKKKKAKKAAKDLPTKNSAAAKVKGGARRAAPAAPAAPAPMM